MKIQHNKHGGGANTNKHGLSFENNTSLNETLKNEGYLIDECKVYDKNNKLIGYSVNKYKFYSVFLKEHSIDYKKFNSKQWLPDKAFVNELNKTIYIIEKKYQNSSGSVDEKLATFPFKLFEYNKLIPSKEYKLEYIYLLNDWFDDDCYKDYFDYMKENNCKYFFNSLPISELGL